MTPDDDGTGAEGPRTHGRPADPFGSPQPDERRRPDADREIPIGVPESPAEFDERKRAAERPDPDPGAGDAQIDYGDDGGSRS